MRFRSIFIVISMYFPLFCHAQENCAWLNAATAGGVLGGPVTMSVSKAHAAASNTQAANAVSSAGPTSADPSAGKYYGNGIDDSDCNFALQSGAGKGTLRVDVRTMKDPAMEFRSFSARCGSHPDALNAIGNEAIACNIHAQSRSPMAQVIGRVRDRAFVIRLSCKDTSEDMLREKIRKVAELVAGNLF